MITLATLKDATAQQVFDQVATHMIKQNKRSLAEKSDHACVYRSADGLKCAAGCLIADSEYKPEMDLLQSSWACLIERKLVPDAHSDLIKDLQYVHDNYLTNKWDYQLRSTAADHDLSSDILDELAIASR